MRRPPPPPLTHARSGGSAGATVLPPAPASPFAASPGSTEFTPPPPDSRTAVPPSLRPSAATVRPPPRRARSAEVLASLFWSAVALGFGASSAAVWWELEVEPRAHTALEGASEVVTRLPDTVTWLQNASHMEAQAAAKAPDVVTRSMGLSEPEASTDAASTDEASTDEASTGAPACAPESFAADEDQESLCEETDLRNVRERSTERSYGTRAASRRQR